jgi:hypothetical protein
MTQNEQLLLHPSAILTYALALPVDTVRGSVERMSQLAGSPTSMRSALPLRTARSPSMSLEPRK